MYKYLVRRRLKMEFTDEDGGKYTITLDGNMSRNKVLKIIDIAELLGNEYDNDNTIRLQENTSFGKLYNLIDKKFPLGSFSSTDILEAYEDEYKTPIRLSTISTYLARLNEKQLLTRQRTPSGWVYRRIRINLIHR